MTVKNELAIFSVLTAVGLAVLTALTVWYHGTDTYKLKSGLKKLDNPARCNEAQTLVRHLVFNQNGIGRAASLHRLRKTLLREDAGPLARAGALELMVLTGEGTNIPPIAAYLNRTNEVWRHPAKWLFEVTTNSETQTWLLEQALKTKSPERAEFMLSVLSGRRDLEALTILEKRFHSRTPEVRAAATAALGDFATLPSLELLAKAAASNELFVVEAALRCISALPPPEQRRALPILRHLHGMAPPELRGRALILLGRIDSPGTIEPLVIAGVGSRSLTEHECALAVAAHNPRFNTPSMTTALLGLYGKLPLSDRLRLLEVFRCRRNPEVLPLARRIFAAGVEEEEVASALELIADLRDAKSFPMLLASLLTRPTPVPDALYDALRVLPDGGFAKVLAENYRRYKPHQRARILYYLADRGAPELMACLYEPVTAKHEETRTAAVAVLPQMPATEFSNLVRFSRKLPRGYRIALMDGIHLPIAQSQAEEEAAGWIHVLFAESAPDEKIALASAVARLLPHPAAVAFLKDLQVNPDPVLNRLAARALKAESGR